MCRFNPSILRLAVCIVLVLVAFACSNQSAEKEFSQATASLSVLEQSDAVFYVEEELRSIRSILENTGQLLRSDQISQASSHLEKVFQRLANVEQTYYARKRDARQHSEDIIKKYKMKIASYATELKAFPSETYVDQNRHDLIRYKLRKMQKQIEKMSAEYKNNSYARVVEMRTRLNQHDEDIATLFDGYRADQHRVETQVANASSEQYQSQSVELQLEPGSR